MINSTSSATSPEVYFAGKKKAPQNAFKAGLVGLLLGSAGGAAALSNPRGNAVDSITDKQATDSLELAHAPRHIINKHRHIDWQALIEDENAQLPEEPPAHRRHLLAPTTTRKSPPPPIKRQAIKAPPPPAKLTPAQAANAAALKLLQQPPFAPTDINIFSTNLYPKGKPMKPLPVTPVNETAILNTLKELFNKRFKGNAAQIKAGLAVYNDPVLKAKVPHPKLRAAIAALKGTASEGAIAVYKSDIFGAVKYNKVRSNAIAQSVQPLGKKQMEVWFSPDFEGEDFRLLLETMAHEALHQDLQVKNTEELIAKATTVLEHGKILTLFPGLAQSGTNLARLNNGAFLDRLNTRTKEGKLSLFTPQKNTAPGSSPPYATIAAVWGVPTLSDASPTPGNPYLRSLLKRVTGKDVLKPNFDANTLKLLDQNQIYLSPSELITIAKAMKLKINPVSTVPASSPRGLLDEELTTGAQAPAPAAEEDLIAGAPETAPDHLFEEAEAPATAPAESSTSETYSRRLLKSFKRA